MTEHKHEGLVGNDGTIRCRTCGQLLPFMTETLSRVSSSRRARRILDEIAVSGRYTASTFNGRFIVFSKLKGNLMEEITANKLGEREFEITKKIVSV